MTKKVIVVDESAFVRGMLSEIVNKSSGFKVTNRYRNLKDNIRSIRNIKADVLVLNIDRGKLEEVEILKREILKEELKVLIISNIRKEELQKEIVFSEVIKYIYIKDDFTADRIREIAGIIIKELQEKYTLPGNNKNLVIKGSKKKIDAILIGASTGGPRALTKLLTGITKRINVPILVVQHMPIGFTKAFAERLDRTCALFNVKEAEDGMIIEKNCIYIAKGGIHMEISKDKKIMFNDDKQIWGVKPAGDKLFVSAAKSYNGNVIACVLTGMGRDCSDGVKYVKELGGINIAESENTCLIYGMPRAAIETGVIDYILDVDKISLKIEELIKGE